MACGSGTHATGRRRGAGQGQGVWEGQGVVERGGRGLCACARACACAGGCAGGCALWTCSGRAGAQRPGKRHSMQAGHVTATAAPPLHHRPGPSTCAPPAAPSSGCSQCPILCSCSPPSPPWCRWCRPRTERPIPHLRHKARRHLLCPAARHRQAPAAEGAAAVAAQQPAAGGVKAHARHVRRGGEALHMVGPAVHLPPTRDVQDRRAAALLALPPHPQVPHHGRAVLGNRGQGGGGWGRGVAQASRRERGGDQRLMPCHVDTSGLWWRWRWWCEQGVGCVGLQW